MATRRFPYRQLAVLALLIGAGAAGNYFSIPLFFGADFLFGSVATMIVVRLYGVWRGTLVAFLISGYTYVLWGHPYGLIIFTLEALVVGLLLRRKPRPSLLLLDGLFWILVGIPLYYFWLSNLIGIDRTGAIFVMLKVGVNGMFNAMVAVLALTHLPIHCWLTGLTERFQVPIREGVFNLLVAFLMVPALILTILVSRHELATINRDIETLLYVESTDAAAELTLWREQYLRRITELGQVAAQEELAPTNRLTDTLRFLIDTSPDFLRVAILTPTGVVVAAASSPGSSALEPVEAINLSEVVKRRELVITDVHATLVAPETPVITVSQPIMKDGRLIGIAQGVLHPKFAHQILDEASEHYPLQLTLLDRHGNVFGTSRPDLKPLQRFDPTAGSEVSRISQGRYHRFPAGQPAALNRWRDSDEVLETAIPGLGGWKVVAEVSLEPYRSRLYRVYIDSLLTVFGLIVFALVLSTLLSRWVTRPLSQLTTITRYLPERLQGGEPIVWPSSSLAEVDSLSADIRWMAEALREQFDELEREARQQRALLSAAMESTNTPVIITDDAERIVYVNPPFLAEYGYTPDEVLGRRPGSFLRGPFSDSKAVARLREAVALGQRITLDLVNQRKDGSHANVELILSPIQDAQGRVTHFVAIQRDISAPKATDQDALNLLSDQMAQSPDLRSAASDEASSPCSILVYAERSLSEGISAILRGDGMHLDTVYDEDDACMALAQKEYAVLLLHQDVSGGGREFLTQLRQSLRHRELPVVLIDPTREQEPGWSLLSAGAWVVDSHDESRLKQAIRYACGKA